MTRGRRRSKGRGKKRQSRGRFWMTLFLILAIGLFALSIYLGQRAQRAREAEITPVSFALPEPIVPTPESPTLVVWNGCGKDGLAGRATPWLRRQGFDVFEIGNADRMDYRQTLVVSRSQRTMAARRVADRLRERLGVGLLISQQVEVPRSDVLLILGNDFPDSLPIY